MNNISKLKNCYGCGVCAATCPQNIIQLSENKDGFYKPRISLIEKCTQCGICLKTCSFVNDLKFDAKTEWAFASYSLNAKIREQASSGGIAFELAKKALSNGFYVCGVIYDKNRHRAVHKVIKSEQELYETLGSKYIPSYTFSAFEELVKNRNHKYLVFGTPCQIASLRLMIRLFKIENNFILVDLFCHGVPSLKVWDKYISSKNISNTDFANIKWRDKKDGWHDSYHIVVTGQNGDEIYKSKNVRDDEFFQFFLGHYALSPCCLESCKYKQYNSLADIRLGDLWGNKYQHEERGVNGVICFTDKGSSLLSDVLDIAIIKESNVTEGQMTGNALKPKGYEIAKVLLRLNISLEFILKIVRIYTSAVSFPIRVINRLRRSQF